MNQRHFLCTFVICAMPMATTLATEKRLLTLNEGVNFNNAVKKELEYWIINSEFVGDLKENPYSLDSYKFKVGENEISVILYGFNEISNPETTSRLARLFQHSIY